MLSTEFEAYFKTLSKFYLGCFSADNYPKQLENNQFFVTNKDNSYQKGSHWLLVMLINDEIQFFDSCGTSEDFVQTFLKFRDKYVCSFNETAVQPNDSVTCGEFCIYFAYRRILNKDQTFKNCINQAFSQNLSKNNEKVTKFCKNLLENGNN